MMIRQRRSYQHGYSLAEMLVVVAIVGIMSLVTVPQFISYMRQNRMRTSVRQFSSDLRGARQRAIARTNPTAISITPNGRRYAIFDRVGTSSPFTWSRIGNWRDLEDSVTFVDSQFADVTVTLPASSTFSIDARTRFASVSSDFSELNRRDDHERNTITGQVGTGGPEIRIDNRNGSIRIEK